MADFQAAARPRLLPKYPVSLMSRMLRDKMFQLYLMAPDGRSHQHPVSLEKQQWTLLECFSNLKEKEIVHLLKHFSKGT